MTASPTERRFDARRVAELALLTAVLVQLTGTLTTITVQQTLYGKQKDGQTS